EPRRGKLLYSRRDRGGSEERGDPGRLLDLITSPHRPHPLDAASELARQRLSVKVANWPPLFSHFSCLFQGSAVSGLASGSLTNATFSFWVAQETSVPAAASNKPVATALSNLRIRTSID